MKKKTIFITAVSAFMTLSAAASAGLTGEVVHTHAADGKTIVEIDVKDETALGEVTIALNCEGDLPDGLANHDFTWYVNNEPKTSVAIRNNTNSLSFGFVGNNYSTFDVADYYRHYQIKKGTVLFTSDTTDYVLKNDYNFWFTRGQNSGGAWLFQHGGTSHYESSTGLTNGNINSLKFTEFGGGCQDFAKRFLFQPKYEETSDPWTYDSIGWQQRCPVFIDKGSGYVLSDTSSQSPIIWEDGKVENNNETLLFGLYYSQVFGGGDTFEEVTMDRSYYSFYIPDGTLWGGIDHPFMIEGDYYFEIVKDASKGYWNGFFDTPHNYVKHDATDETEGKYGNIEYYTCSRNTHSNETDEYFVKNADETYTKTTLADTEIKTSHENATKWAQEFIKKTKEPCSDQNADNYNKLIASDVWPALKTSYDALDDVAKQVLKTNTKKDTDIETAMSLYNYIITKYTNITDFIGATTSKSSSVSNIISNKIDANNSIMIISLIAFISVSTIGGVVLLKKKRQ